MDIFLVVYTAIAAAFLGSTSVVVNHLVELVLSLFVTTLVVDEFRSVYILDREISSNGYCSRRQAGFSRFPAEGVHFIYLLGPVVAIKSLIQSTSSFSGVQHKYTIYSFRNVSSQYIEKITAGDPTENFVKWIGKNGNRTSHMRIKAPAVPFAWQQNIMGKIIAAFKEKRHVSVLLSGAPGIGKSRLAELLATELRRNSSVEPTIVKNYDPSDSFVSFDSVIGNPIVSEPLIVVLDEYDAIIQAAEAKPLVEMVQQPQLRVHSSRTVMLGVLDLIALVDHVIVIATMNAAISSVDAAYTRPGRFDHHFTITADSVMALSSSPSSSKKDD
jgi:hypothetical protein